MRTRQLTVLAVAGVVSAGLLGAPANGTPAHRSGVRQSDDSARVVARVDVNGNGKKDVVRFKKRGTHRLVVRVKTDRGRVDRKVVRAPGISFGGWHGAARLDGHRGRELALLTSAGAHSLSYTTLTWRRKNGLKVLKSPEGGSWLTDGAAMMGAGYLRKVRRHHGKRRVSMTSRYLVRAPRRPVWKGKATRYVWRHGDWHKRGRHKIKVRGDRKAQKRFGWRNTGLRPFPR